MHPAAEAHIKFLEKEAAKSEEQAKRWSAVARQYHEQKEWVEVIKWENNKAKMYRDLIAAIKADTTNQ